MPDGLSRSVQARDLTAERLVPGPESEAFPTIAAGVAPRRKPPRSTTISSSSRRRAGGVRHPCGVTRPISRSYAAFQTPRVRGDLVFPGIGAKPLMLRMVYTFVLRRRALRDRIGDSELGAPATKLRGGTDVGECDRQRRALLATELPPSRAWRAGTDAFRWPVAS